MRSRAPPPMPLPACVRVTPAPPLDRWVECLWYLRRRSVTHARELALPDGRMHLIVNLDADRFVTFADADDRVGRAYPGAIVVGAYARHFVIDTARPRASLGVCFRPGGAARFLGVPADAIGEAHVALADVWGASADRLRQRLMEAPTLAQQFALLREALLARLLPAPSHEPAVAFALRHFGSAPARARIAAVQRESGLGATRFIAAFAATVGLTPKRWCRVVRLRAVVEQMAASSAVDWAAVADEAGFTDQPHLTREFRAFAGVTPAAYRPLTPSRALHMAIAGP